MAPGRGGWSVDLIDPRARKLTTAGSAGKWFGRGVGLLICLAVPVVALIRGDDVFGVTCLVIWAFQVGGK